MWRDSLEVEVMRIWGFTELDSFLKGDDWLWVTWPLDTYLLTGEGIWLMQEFDFNHCVLRGHFQTLLPSRLPGSAVGQRGSVIPPVWPLRGMWCSHSALWSAGRGHTPCIWPHGLFVTFPLGVNAINCLLGAKSLPSCFCLVIQIHSCLPSGSLTVTT